MIKSPSLPKRLSSLPNSPYHMVSSLWQVNRIFFYRLKNHWISGVISQLMQRPFVEKVKQNKAIETKGDKLLIAVKRYMYCQTPGRKHPKGWNPLMRVVPLGSFRARSMYADTSTYLLIYLKGYKLCTVSFYSQALLIRTLKGLLKVSILIGCPY